MTDTKKNSALADPVPAKMTDAEIHETALAMFGQSREFSNCYEAPSDRSVLAFARAIESRALSSAAVQEPEELVTRESALQAIEHMEQYNGPGRSRDAVQMLVAAPVKPQEQPVADDQRRKVIKGLCHQQSYDDDGRKCIVAREAVEEAIALLSAAPAQPQEQPVAAQQQDASNDALEAAAVIVEELDIEEDVTKYVPGNAAYELDQAARKIRALQRQAHPAQAPQQDASAYQRGYMDGIAKGRRQAEEDRAEAAPPQEPVGVFCDGEITWNRIVDTSKPFNLYAVPISASHPQAAQQKGEKE